jgi:beta-glucosidase-like glycosyl hydrolase
MLWRLLIPVLALAVTGCPKTAPPASVGDAPDPAAYEALEAQNRSLKENLSRQERELSQKDALIGRLQLHLLESDARYKALADKLSAQQDRLDEAVVEVVRTKAKLRSIESRAEAASSITEVEIALKSLKDTISAVDGNQGEDYEKAEALLRMSTSEFKKENYGGALFLAGQAQSQIRAMEGRFSRQVDESTMPGEVLFAQPLPLEVLKRSNMRQEPSLQSPIVRTLDSGERVIGYSYKEEWIRIHSDDGAKGWIFQSLVSGR